FLPARIFWTKRGRLFIAGSSPALSALSSGFSDLKQLEIFPLLPLGDLRLVASDLRILDAQVVIDKAAAEAIGETIVVAQRPQRLLEALRQLQRLRLVGRICRGTRVEHALHAVEAGEDLRGHVEIRIGRRLADPVLEPCRRIAGAAEH